GFSLRATGRYDGGQDCRFRSLFTGVVPMPKASAYVLIAAVAVLAAFISLPSPQPASGNSILSNSGHPDIGRYQLTVSGGERGVFPTYFLDTATGSICKGSETPQGMEWSKVNARQHHRATPVNEAVRDVSEAVREANG